MTREEFLEDCKQNIIFDKDNFHTSVDDVAYCPLCGSQMKWNGHLFCDCFNQKEYFQSIREIDEKIDSLNKVKDQLMTSVIDRSIPFFKDIFLEKMKSLRESIIQDEKDVSKF